MSDPIAQILKSTHPEDLFGRLEGTLAEQLQALKAAYRRLARASHPDRHKDNPQAEEAFGRLRELREQAETALTAGTYGTRRAPEPVTVASRTMIYELTGAARATELADLYAARTATTPEPVLLKIARTPQDTDLLVSEARILRHLREPDRPEAAGFLPLLPDLCESFRLTGSPGGRQVNVFARLSGFYTLEQVRSAYPAGLDPRHMAWMFRQLLLALGYVHARGVMHGAVLPHHVLVHPAHDLLLVEFTAAVRDPTTTGVHIPYLCERYEDWYPPEVTAKQPPSPATDIAMAARCMSYLLEGRTVPPRISGFLASCRLPRMSRRPQSAWATRDEFTRLIEDLWGPRRRIPFTMPTTNK